MSIFIRFSNVVLFSALLALTGCGDDKAAGTAPPPPPGTQGSGKWTAQELSTTTEACAKGGQQSLGNTVEAWRIYCGCIYGIASQRWTIKEFSANFKTDFQTLRDDNSHATCISKAAVPNF